MVRRFIFTDFIRRHIWRYLLGIAFVMLSSLLELSIPKLIGHIIDSLRAATATQTQLFWWTGAILAIAAAMFAVRLLWRYLLIGAAMQLECELRERFFAHLQTLPPQFYNNRKTGELMAYAINDLQAIRQAFAAGLVWLLRGVSANLFSIVIMAHTINARLTLLALIPIVCSTVVVLVLRPMIRARFEVVQEKFAVISDTVQENLAGIRVIKSFGQEAAEIDKLATASQERLNAHMRHTRAAALYDPAVKLLFGLSFTLNLFLGSAYVMQGIITLGDFIAFNAYIALLTTPVTDLGRVVVRWQNAAASITRLERVMNVRSEIFDAIPPAAAARIEQRSRSERRFRGDIRIQRLDFTYPGDPAPTLHNINLHVNAGQTLAIVGDTGSGKTTLANLLVRLFKVERGHIFLDDVDLNDIPLAVLRENIGYAPQDNFLFSTSIKQNIASFKDYYAHDDIAEATRVSQVYDDIADFPEGFDTVLGERGITLSGGQKQRVSLARAIIKDPSILILDDTFSAVDTETEEGILQNLRGVMAARTTILIAHRISTVKYADDIIVLDRGRIIEHGAHAALLARRGKYYEMHLAQLIEDEKP
jgi:ATP-binding cassette, subfamily B, multidrug efflux pump